MSIPHGKFMPLPLLLYLLLWVELAYFLFATVYSYFWGMKEAYYKLSPMKMGRLQLWVYSMTYAVGTGVVAYMILDMVIKGTISRIEVEVLFVSHAAWLSTSFCFLPPLRQPAAVALLHPHVILPVLLSIVAWNLPRWGCLIFCGCLVLFGIRRNFEYREVVFAGQPWTLETYHAAEKELKQAAEEDAPETQQGNAQVGA
mmetsp:Transcript_5055/g.15603  ORF Transcript_5055/g.15603 Transcript_5055/m.15603 type:complete len:200 (-) Transcript_5055:115-714(-)